MTLAKLQQLVSYHKSKAEYLAKAASLMGECPAATEFLGKSTKQAAWAADLHEFAEQLRTAAIAYLNSNLP
jgi:hypothetical protein